MMVIIEFESVFFFFFCFANFTIDLSANWGQSSSWLSNRSIYHYPLRKWPQFLRIRLIEFPQAYNCLWHIIIPTENFPGKLSSTRTTGKSFSALIRLNLNRYRAQLELHLESTFHNPLTVITRGFMRTGKNWILSTSYLPARTTKTTLGPAIWSSFAAYYSLAHGENPGLQSYLLHCWTKNPIKTLTW